MKRRDFLAAGLAYPLVTPGLQLNFRGTMARIRSTGRSGGTSPAGYGPNAGRIWVFK